MHMPEKMQIALNYQNAGNYTLTYPNNLPLYRTYRLNNIHDPDTDTDISYKPYLANQLYALYRKCRVVSATVTYKLHYNQANVFEILAGPLNNTAIPALSVFRHQKQTITKLMSAYKPVYIKKTYNINRLLGENKLVSLIDDTHEQVSGSGPSKNVDWTIFINNIGVQSGTYLMSYTVDVVYNCIFSDNISPDVA